MPGNETHIQHQVCSSCAVASIVDIRVCKNAIHVLRVVCENELGSLSDYRRTYSKMACFYIFCAGPEVKQKEPGGSHWSNDAWPRYGTEFAEYLVKKKLGTVTTLGPKENKKHHPGSTAQLWMWSPDQRAVEKWWEDYQAGRIK